MIYALSGVHGSGKTTTLNALQDTSDLKDFTFITELTRTLKSWGFDINESGGDNTQLAVATLHLHNILQGYTSRGVVVDRSLLDGYVYTKFLHQEGRVTSNTLNLVENIFIKHIWQYDKIFLFAPHSGGLKDDGVRSVDTHFYESIQTLFEEVSERPYVKPKIIRIEDGTVEQRRDFILEKIMEEEMDGGC